MLNIESRMEVLGVTVFQDYDRPTQFYYLPGQPHISRENGMPLFELYSYRLGGETSEIDSGGFLNMAVDVGIRSVKNRILDRLKELHGDEVTLAAVPFTRGTARIVALGEDSGATAGVAGAAEASGSALVAGGPRFIEQILGPGAPSLDGDNRAIFSFSLSEKGAAFFLEVLNGVSGARPVGVVYDLEYTGLLPAYDLEITIDFKSCYEYMRSRFTLGTLFFKADIDTIVEELKRKESIKIKEVSRTLALSEPEAVQSRQERIDRLVKELAGGALFNPSLVPGEPRVQGETMTAADPTASVGTAGLSPTMEALRRGPAAAVVAGMGEAYGRAANPTGERGGAGASATQPSGQPSAPTGSASADAPSARTTTPEAPANGGNSTSAADVWNRLGRPQAAFVQKNIRQEEQRTVTYNLTQVTAQKQTVAPQSFIQFLAPPSELNRHVYVVDLNHLFFQKISVNINAADVNFAAEGISQMTVQIRYGTRPQDSAAAILRTNTESKDFTFFLDKKLTRSYEYRLVVDYLPNFGIGYREGRIEGPWIKSELRSLRVYPGMIGHVLPISVELAPNTPPDLAEAHVKVRYANTVKNVDDSILVKLTPQNRAVPVFVRVVEATDTFEVTSTLFYSDGDSETLATKRFPDALSAESEDVVLVSVPTENRIAGDVIMQDPLGELQSVLVDTQVQQGSAIIDSRSFEMDAGNTRAPFFVRLEKLQPPPVLRYRERRIFKDGGLEPMEWKESDSANIVVGIPAGRVMSVTIRYTGPALADLGLGGIMLDLEYRDPAGDERFHQSASKFIGVDSATYLQEWKVRLADSRARTYTRTMTLLFTDGTEKTTQPIADTCDLITIRPQI